MKKIIFPCLAFLFLASCTQVNSNGEKTITQGDDTISDVNISLSKMDAVEELANMKEEGTAELLFKASGTEPGWYAEFYADRIFIVANEGTAKITVKRKNEDLNQTTDVVINIGSGAADNITIENKTCTNMAGEKESRSVKLVYNGKLYSGCGSFVKK
jgi:uncharacterized membrane protein